MDVRSFSPMQENSSMAQTPLSARTSAPASRVNSFPESSLTAAQVSPAEVVPEPDVRTDRGHRAAANRKNWDCMLLGRGDSRVYA